MRYSNNYTIFEHPGNYHLQQLIRLRTKMRPCGKIRNIKAFKTKQN
jgi:hypothetical protein